ncbi:MAG: hypothetical protein FXF49_11875 [Flexistipes sinusarabici]|uniref:Core-binding (CB) domain-containing protein n=1 Tax=Flexistipes sinusarabici TaxID=2352 RepID=A0A5D0MKC5_FLESI|nr:hypothetical protein [Flexistipes sinusarabici]TYB32365.1 MAG: hypothetical protein FXF49_11875 [Flexistipes sinusarabici]
MKNILFEEFRREYRITGSNSNLKQVYRLINQFLEFVRNKYPHVRKIEMIRQDQRNAYYKHLKKMCEQGKISKSYLKDTLYATNKFFKEINKHELCYDVIKILKSTEGKKELTVTFEEYENVKALRRRYGKILTPEQIKG